ncbi:MAG TPA: beta-L-arabinofuranosidase domain-containing protein [Trebonia sp.]|jgi:hypothetical protein
MAPADLSGPVGRSSSPDWAHYPAPGRETRLTGGLLGEWQRRNVDASLPLALRQLDAAGNLDNVRLAISVSEGGPAGGAGYRGPVFMDSDIHKTLEAIGWELQRGPRPGLTAFADDVISLLERAQRPDGYLNSWFQATGEPRYSRLSSSHEMYCAGHLIQAAIAMRRGSGDDRLLAVAEKFADHLVREFAGDTKGLDGHPIIETALVELYRETGAARYLDLARQFVDQRGSGLAGDSGMGRRYLADHVPVRSSATEVGHVVRALYLEAGVTDVAAETGDRELLETSIRRWEDMVATKTSLTGGNGSRHSDEGFGDRFELPPDRAYNETCAAIASFHWSWRLLLATGDSRYADHMERVLYNGFGAALSADGTRFFYVNPLQRREDHYEKDDPGQRHAWFSCACCPPNIMRLLASLHHYLATTDADTLYLQQLASARITGAGLSVETATDYPWQGRVEIRVIAAKPGERGLAVRVPAWGTGARYRLNNDPEQAVPAPPPGNLVLRRQWHPGDTVTVDLGLAPRWTLPDRRVDAIRGCAAVERGPLVYCFEQPDQIPGAAVDDLAVAPGATMAEEPVTLPGVGPTVRVAVPARSAGPDSVTAVAIPYFQWDNRDRGAMRVWLPAD